MKHYFNKIIHTIKSLRDPDSGCPWDLKQTHETLAPYLIEESYELLQVLNSSDKQNLKEELGDVLLQVLLHAQLASERGEFSMEDVCQELNEKLIRRHPHVFKDKENNISLAELNTQWKAIKSKEGKKQDEVLPQNLLHNPSLLSSYKIGKKTEGLDFDWDSLEEVIEQFDSEVKELKSEVSEANKEKMAEELGDVFFSLAQVSRHMNLNPEMILNKANQKFHRRFTQLIKLVEDDKKIFEKLSRKEKEEYWKKVKNLEKTL